MDIEKTDIFHKKYFSYLNQKKCKIIMYGFLKKYLLIQKNQIIGLQVYGKS